MPASPRRKKSRPVLVGLLILCASVSLGSLYYMWSAGSFQDLQAHGPSCAEIPGVMGAEDLVISRDGFVFISALDRRVQASGQKWQEGTILGLALDHQEQGARPVLAGSIPGGLFPRGLSLYEGEGPPTLFVINYQTDGYAIEVFAWEGGALNHRASLKSPLLNQPGHIVAVGPRQFYVSNERGLYTPTGHMIEDTFGLRQASVLYFDGSDFRVAAKGLAYAGGLAIYHDRLFVTELNGKSLRVYRGLGEAGPLTLETSIPLPSFANHVKASPEALWVSAHPQMLLYQSHAMNPGTAKAPSQVFRISPQAGAEQASPPYQVEEFLLMTEGPLSGATVAAPYGKHLLLGAAFEDKLLWCPQDR